MTSLNYNKKELITDVVITVVIVLLPFLFYLYTFAPKNQKVWITNWFTLDAGRFEYINYFLWVLSYKILMLSILSIWYVSCKHWWRYLIFVPIFHEIYKLCDFIYESHYLLGDFIIYRSLLISVSYSFFLMFLSAKLCYFKKNRTDNYELNLEIIKTFNKTSQYNEREFKLIKKELSLLRKQKSNMPKKEYLAKFIALRDRLTLD